MTAPRSAAIQIVRPPADPPKPATPSGQAGLTDSSGFNKGKRDTTQRVCRNVMLYGSCRVRDQGCVYQHPPANEIIPPSPKVESPIQDYLLPGAKNPRSMSELRPEHLSAPVFIPKTPLNDSQASPSSTAPSVDVSHGAEDWPNAGGGGLVGNGIMGDSGVGMQQSMTRISGYDDYGVPGQMDGMYMPHQPIRQTLDYHLYVSPQPPAPPQPATSLHSFFIADDLRNLLTHRQEITYSHPSNPPPGLPAEVGPYHELTPLDDAGARSRVYGHPAPVYKARSGVDGNWCVLRRIEGFKLVNEAAFGSIEHWRRIRHPGIITLREGFTTKAFDDNSLILVYDYHPVSSTIFAEHLSSNPRDMQTSNNNLNPSQNRHRLTVPERQLWSYITQICNALMCLHHSGLAARNLDPTKILLTGKNRIRLNGCGIMDVLVHDPNTPVAVYQQEDLVSFGKLILHLACEFFSLNQHPSAPLEHVARTYGSDMKKLVLYLIGPPSQHKNIEEVVKLLGSRILNEFDAGLYYTDALERELGSELENGRLVRLLTKMGFINERAEFEMDPRWSDTGDRYIVKLFRDYVFHSLGADGKPILDLSHVLTCLNKLDAGLDERIMLVSRDDHSILVVTYREIKSCVDVACNELRNATGAFRVLR